MVSTSIQIYKQKYVFFSFIYCPHPMFSFKSFVSYKRIYEDKETNLNKPLELTQGCVGKDFQLCCYSNI